MNERKTFTYMNRNNILLQKKSKVISTNKKKKNRDKHVFPNAYSWNGFSKSQIYAFHII